MKSSKDAPQRSDMRPLEQINTSYEYAVNELENEQTDSVDEDVSVSKYVPRARHRIRGWRPDDEKQRSKKQSGTFNCTPQGHSINKQQNEQTDSGDEGASVSKYIPRVSRRIRGWRPDDEKQQSEKQSGTFNYTPQEYPVNEQQNEQTDSGDEGFSVVSEGWRPDDEKQQSEKQSGYTPVKHNPVKGGKKQQDPNSFNKPPEHPTEEPFRIKEKPHITKSTPLLLDKPLVMVNPVKVFYCYATEDKGLRDKLDSHLTSLKRLKQITLRLNRDVPSGTSWEHIVDRHFQSADLILLLISPSFIQSEFHYSAELFDALEKYYAGHVAVIPILLRPTHGWEGMPEQMPLGRLQALPRNKKAISQWRDQDAVLAEIVGEIAIVVANLLTRKPENAFLTNMNQGKPFGSTQGPSCASCSAPNPLGSTWCCECGDLLLSNISKDTDIIHLPDTYEDDVTKVPSFLNYIMHDLMKESPPQITPEDWIQEGDMHRNLKQYPLAIAAYTSAIQLDPRSALAYFSRGLAYLELHQKRHALADFERALHHAFQLVYDAL